MTDLRNENFSGADAVLFKRHENFRDFARKVLGTEIVLTPSSDGVHIRAVRHVPDVGVTYNSATAFVSRLEITDCIIDVVSLNMLQCVKDVGGFDGLH